MKSEQPIWRSLIEEMQALPASKNLMDYRNAVNDCIAVIRTHLVNQPPVDEAYIYPKGYGPSDPMSSYPHDPAIEAALNKPKVSLEKCVFAAWQNALHADTPNGLARNISKGHCAKITKAVLDAAGVDYE